MIDKNSNGQNISADFISALTADSRTYDVKIIYDGSALDCPLFGLSITKGSSGDESGFSIGSIVGSTLTFTTDTLPTSVKGEELEVQIGVSVGESYEYVTMGTFVVADVQKTLYRTTVTAYGATITRTGDAFVVPQTQTLANIASSISTSMSALAGRTISVTFDSGITTSKNITASMNGLTVYQALGVLASVCGGFVMDTYDGNIKVCRFSDTPTLVRDTSTMLTLPVVAETDFEIAGVLCIVSPESEDDEGEVIPAVQFPANPTGDENLVLQNEYMTQDLYTSYLATLTGYEYRPATIGLTYGDPRLEGNDVVQITDTDGNVYVVPCHMLTHTYDGGFSTEVIAVQATPQENDVSSSAGSLTETLSNVSASAISARASAESAKASADSALEYAETAKETTDEIVAYAETAGKTVTQILNDGETAGEMARQATASATSALKGLATVEDVVDTLNWIATHCQYEKTTDVTIVTGKAYYTVTATQVASPTDADIATYYELVSGAYVKTTDTSVVSGKTYYTVVGEPVTNPVVADIDTYYELEITEAVSNYINTHVAVTDEGLWLVPDDTQGSNKVLVAVGGQGHTYPVAGTYILDGNDNILAQFLASGAQIGKNGGAHSIIDADGQRFYARDGTTQLANIGYGSGASESGTATAPYYDFGIRKSGTTKGNYSVAEGVDTTASGYASHAEGSGTLASGHRSHAEGSSVNENSVTKPATASGSASHAEGLGTTASGSASHAEGLGTTASGNYSHAGGTRTEAQGENSVAYGYGTIANKIMQVAIGTFNAIDPGDNPDAAYGDGKYLFIIGNGQNSTTGRHNALTVDWAGNIELAGTVKDFIVTDTKSKSTGSISANTGVEVTIDVTKTGYTPIGIIGIRFTGASSGYCQPRQFRIDNGSAIIYAWNSHTSAHTWTAYCTVLYVKNAG
jgi:hypothetical protein